MDFTKILSYKTTEMSIENVVNPVRHAGGMLNVVVPMVLSKVVPCLTKRVCT